MSDAARVDSGNVRRTRDRIGDSCVWIFCITSIWGAYELFIWSNTDDAARSGGGIGGLRCARV